ncbi:MAG: membrane protein insertion efficiency factor YidD [Candidatus Micrarchaeia archaeon]
MVKRCLLKLNVLFVGLLLINSESLAQVKNDLDFIIQVNAIKTDKKSEASKFTLKEISESKLLATGLIRLYQLFISSQDMPVCNFTQTCSHFGMEAIQKYGIFWGVLMTADRLQRCNGIGMKYYPIDLETGRAIDYPVETYYLRIHSKKSVKTANKE